jgi:hypothetical protein
MPGGKTLAYFPGTRRWKLLMDPELYAEFAMYRDSLHSEADREEFDRAIESLLDNHGIDFVRGYVRGLREGFRKYRH